MEGNNKRFKPVKALAHTAPYKIHRYFARRPWNLFEALVGHYSEPGQIILDPFAGGGVTAYEGVRLNRKVVACDINPLSNFIVKNMFHNVDMGVLEQAYEDIYKYIRALCADSFDIECPDCGADTQADWYELVHTVECNGCKATVHLNEQNKVRNGMYKCPNTRCWNHKKGITVAREKRLEPVYLSIHGNCQACKKRVGLEVDTRLNDANKEQVHRLSKMVRAKKAELPLEYIPENWDRQKEDLLNEKGFYTFQDLFTKKNLLLNYLLLAKIKEYSSYEDIYPILRFIFSDSIRDTNIMTFTNNSWQNGTPTTWAKHAYWLPAQFCEVNVSKAFAKSYESIKKCIVFNTSQGVEAKYAFSLNSLNRSDANLLLKTGVLSQLQLPDESIDAVITDPPYGSNVQYLELSHFWYLWNKDLYDVDAVDQKREAVVNRKKGLKDAKTYKTYEDNLYEVFAECNRVIKTGGHIVMTFNNKDINSWLALLISIFRAGFHFEPGGIAFQDGVSSYKHTAHTKAKGSPYGDFVYEFVKYETKQFKSLKKSDREQLAERILQRIDLAISQYQGGGNRNTVLVSLFNEIVPEIEQYVKSSSDEGGAYDLYVLFRKSHLEPLYA